MFPPTVPLTWEQSIERWLRWYYVTDTGCWQWTGATTVDGYGVVRWGDKTLRAHRVAFQVAHGSIPEGHVLDHTCHRPETCNGGRSCPHRSCINPAHLAAVLPGQNGAAERACRPNRRLTECSAGHLLSGDNVYEPPNQPGRRQCRACVRDRSREWYRKNRVAGRQRSPDVTARR